MGTLAIADVWLTSITKWAWMEKTKRKRLRHWMNRAGVEA